MWIKMGSDMLIVKLPEWESQVHIAKKNGTWVHLQEAEYPHPTVNKIYVDGAEIVARVSTGKQEL